MNEAFKSELSQIWQQILLTNPKAIFGAEVTKLSNRHYADAIPQPGFVGSNYRRGGLLFVAMNPGGGADENDPDDHKIYSALQRLRNADAKVRNEAFDEANVVHRLIVPEWKIWANFVSPILRCTGITMQEVAYINLLKWRTQKSSGLERLYGLSWEAHTCRQVEALAPGAVVAIGSDAGRVFDSRYKGNIYIGTIPRAVGNNLRQESHDAIKQVCVQLKDVFDKAV